MSFLSTLIMSFLSTLQTSRNPHGQCHFYPSVIAGHSTNVISIHPAKVISVQLQILSIQLCKSRLYPTCKYYLSWIAKVVSIQPANTIYPGLQKSSLSNLQILSIQLCKWCLYPTCKYYPSSSANGVFSHPAHVASTPVECWTLYIYDLEQETYGERRIQTH